MRANRLLAGVVFVGVLAVLGYAGYLRYLGPEIEPTPTALDPLAPTDEGPSIVSAEGVILPAREVGVAFRVSGRVAEILVEEGQRVETGEVLARLESAHAEAAVAQAESGLDLAQAQRAQALAGARPEEIAILEAQLDASPTDDQRRVVEAQLDLARAGPTEEQVAVADAVVRQAEAALDAARTALADLTLEAPFDWTVVELELEVGEVTVPGAPAVLLGDLAHWSMVTNDLAETVVVNLRPGQRARVTVDAFPGGAFAATVREIALLAETNRGNVTYAVTMDLEPTQALLRWGMTAFVDIQVSSPN